MKLFLSLFFVMISWVALASEFNVVNTGSQSGGFNATLTMVSKNLDHKYIQAGNPVVAESHFGMDNVVTIWSSEWTEPKVYVNEDNIVSLLVFETVLCSRKFDSFQSMSGKSIKIGSWGNQPVKKFLKALGKTHNISFTVVPYKGSGNITKGFLGKDVDTVFVTESKRKKIEVEGKCFASSSSGELLYSFVDAILLFNGNNGAKKASRRAVESATKTDEWKTAMSGVAVYVPNTSNQTDVLNKFLMAQEFNR